MTRAAVCLLLAAALLHTSALAAPEPDCTTRPEWCPKGWYCAPTACAAEAAAQLTLLTAELDVCRTREPDRWGFCAGAGIGVTAAPYDRDPTERFDPAITWHAGGQVGVLWGYRFGGRRRAHQD